MGMFETYTYDGLGRLTNETELIPAGVPTLETRYSYDPNGNQTAAITNSIKPTGGAQPSAGIFIQTHCASGDFLKNKFYKNGGFKYDYTQTIIYTYSAVY